jgi:Zn-dependent protease
MPTKRSGAIHLTRVAGIDLYLHWSWFVVALIEIQIRRGSYHSMVWNVLEYVALFAIVLLHEFGHALACRQVGGTANTIMLWPLGGVAYVDPPERPGAVLWSIVAGPLVNVALFPVLLGAVVWVGHVDFLIAFKLLIALVLGIAPAGLMHALPDFFRFVVFVAMINVGLFVFNMLPVYPLDGGKILWSLLWFWLGKSRSLLVASWLGVVGTAGLLALGLWWQSVWTILISVYMGMSCWRSIKYARQLVEVEKLPRRDEYKCPSCGQAPPIGEYWKCDLCNEVFDTFATRAVCPHCNKHHPATGCPFCRRMSLMEAWGAQPKWAGSAVVEHEQPAN